MGRQLIIILLFIPLLVFGQNRKALEEQRKQLIEEIEQTASMLAKTKENKEAALDRYFALQGQIKKRQQLINTLKEELILTEASILRVDEVTAFLNNDIDRLKEEYSQMIKVAYRHRKAQSFLVFLFSARNFNDAFRRWQYIRQYDRYRKRQANVIIATQKSLMDKAALLVVRKTEKQKLLASSLKQSSLLSKELEEKNTILNSLKENENQLAKALKQQQGEHQALNDAIEHIILGEMERKRKEARSSDALTKNQETKATLAPEVAAGGLVTDFKQNKGRLPWPVQEGIIIKNFGTQPHPTLKGIQVSNNGIDIETEKDAAVFAIFDGEVVGVQFIPGYKTTLILQHGEYYSVYSNLEDTFVKRGEQIKASQKIGKVSNEKPELHFEIWREKQRLNPVYWVNKSKRG
ncbi:MAG: peptidoglycan DD-metalloendopeptidase family protein [Saprospiraceae bacterium]